VLPSGVVVSLPPAFDPEERVTLGALVERQRRAVATRLGVPPVPVRVRVHDSNDSFEQTTHVPAFALAAVVNGEVHLAPLWLLRERGMLERAVTRQLVRQLVDPVLPARPAWLREGAAVYYADDATSSSPSARLACPQDAELTAPASPGALGDALARARACVERQVSGGRDWRRLR
jgi:hypothetical protein